MCQYGLYFLVSSLNAIYSGCHELLMVFVPAFVLTAQQSGCENQFGVIFYAVKGSKSQICLSLFCL